MKSSCITKQRVNISVDLDLVAAYDVACGLASRSALMNAALRQVAEEKGLVPKKGEKA